MLTKEQKKAISSVDRGHVIVGATCRSDVTRHGAVVLLKNNAISTSTLEETGVTQLRNVPCFILGCLSPPAAPTCTSIHYLAFVSAVELKTALPGMCMYCNTVTVNYCLYVVQAQY